MSFTVGDAVLAARDLNPAFTPTRHPDAVCWRFLARHAKTLAGKIAQLRPRALTATVTTVSLATYDFAVGMTLPANLLLLDATVHPVSQPSTTLRPVEILPGGNRFTRGTALPWGWRDGTKFFLAGEASQWTAYDNLYVRTLAMPTAAASADVLPFEDDALDVCASALGAFLAKRHASGPDTKGFSPDSLIADAMTAERDYLDRLTNQGRAEVWSIRRVRS